jgi:hypothetical protein
MKRHPGMEPFGGGLHGDLMQHGARSGQGRDSERTMSKRAILEAGNRRLKGRNREAGNPAVHWKIKRSAFSKQPIKNYF